MEKTYSQLLLENSSLRVELNKERERSKELRENNLSLRRSLRELDELQCRSVWKGDALAFMIGAMAMVLLLLANGRLPL